MSTSNVVGGVPASFPSDRICSHYAAGSTTSFLSVSELSNPTPEILKMATGLAVITSTPVAVPRSFFGINPSGQGRKMQAGDMSGYPYGLARSHDCTGTRWKEMQLKIDTLTRVGNLVTAYISSGFINVTGDSLEITNAIEAGFNGVFPITYVDSTHVSYISPVSGNAIATTASIITAYSWDYLDAFVAVNKAAGLKVMHTVYLTPSYLSSGTSTSPYGGPGYNNAPASMATLSAFVAKTAQRYLDKGMPIDLWENNNEPNFTVNGFRFFADPVAKLAEMQRTIYQAVKPITPSAGIVCPSVTNLPGNGQISSDPDLATTYFLAMMSASDGAAGTMAQWVDYVGIHLYCDKEQLLSSVNIAKAMVAAAGLTGKPIIDTENGLNGTLSATDHSFYTSMIRYAVVAAAAGLYAQVYYELGSDVVGVGHNYNIAMRPLVLARVSKIIDKIVTYGITSAALLADGRVAFKVNGENFLV